MRLFGDIEMKSIHKDGASRIALVILKQEQETWTALLGLAMLCYDVISYGILWHSKKALEDTGKMCFDLPDSKPEQNKFQY